jgi:hypothetical protein
MLIWSFSFRWSFGLLPETEPGGWEYSSADLAGDRPSSIRHRHLGDLLSLLIAVRPSAGQHRFPGSASSNS